jgi:hypothetical protein
MWYSLVQPCRAIWKGTRGVGRWGRTDGTRRPPIPCATNCAWPFLGRKAGGSDAPAGCRGTGTARRRGAWEARWTGAGRFCRLPPAAQTGVRTGWCVSRRLRLRLRRDTDATSPRTTLASATALPESRTRPRHAVLAPRLPPVRSRRQSERASGLWVAREWSV